MLPISEQYLLSPCEVRSMENAPILMGYISKLEDGEVRIASKEERLPLLHCNTTVKVSVMNNTLGFKVLIGRVYLSTNEFLRVVDVQNAMEYEKRNFFRVKVGVDTKAFPVPPVTETSAVPLPMREPIKITIRDISLSGLFFISSCDMDIGDQLIVNLDLYGTVVSLLCKVMRKIPVDLGTQDGYGCEFLDNSGRQFDLLCRYLFDCQREQIQLMEQYARETQHPREKEPQGKGPGRPLKKQMR